MRIIRLTLSISLLLCAAQARAYGPLGHQIVGAIADEKLAGTPTGKKVAEMIDGFTLQKAAVIADEIKGWDKKGADDPGIFHYSSRPKIDEQLRAFWRANQPTKDPHSAAPSHHWFHYTDVPVLGAEKYGDGKVGRSEWDIVHMMRHCIAVLRGEEPEENARKITKPIAIILLAHYVGDIHQPLHVGAEYFNAAGQPADPDKGATKFADQGGNTITLSFVSGRKKLHGYWDNDVVTALLPPGSAALLKEERRAGNANALDALIHKFATEEPKGWRLPANVIPNEYPEAWANEILPIAREAHERLQFQGIHTERQDEETLASGSAIEKPAADKVSYHDWSAGVARDELHKAGWRLADLLEKVLQPSSPGKDSRPSPATPSPAVSATNGTPSPSIAPITQVATVTRQIAIRVPYGTALIPVGTKLPYSARSQTAVRVHYMGADYDVPITSTDVQ